MDSENCSFMKQFFTFIFTSIIELLYFLSTYIDLSEHREPGYYEENNFGLRLENLVVVVPAHTKYNKTDKKLLTFSPLTMVPYERKFIETSLMDLSEIEWVNNYHKLVLETVGEEILKYNEAALYQWLKEKTAPLT